MSKATSILVADDDPAILHAIAIRLRSQGFRVIEALDAIHALRECRRRRPDLLILDVNMPAGDGFTVLQRVREIEGLRHIPVIYVTGERSERAVRSAKKAGAVRLLHKPISHDHLLDAIDEALGNDAGRTQRAIAQLQQAADEWIANHR